MTPSSSSSSIHHGYLIRATWILIPAGLLLLLSGAALHGLLSGQSVRAYTEDSFLSLRVQPVESALLLSWDKNARLVSTADRAVLTITDGNRQETVDLNLTFFRRGQVVYEPISNDVAFRLAISRRADGTTAHDSVRVLNFHPPGPAPRTIHPARSLAQTASTQPLQTSFATPATNASAAATTPVLHVSAAANLGPLGDEASHQAP